MPHCILEYSDNCVDDVQMDSFFKGLHSVLMKTGEFQLDRIKSRATKHSEYVVGNGDKENAFVHLHVYILTGRSVEKKKEIGQLAHEYCVRYFERSFSRLTCSITCEVKELNRDFYFVAKKD